MASAFASTTNTDDWARFQGPHANGSVTDAGFQYEWSDGGGPKEAWTVAIGKGYGGVAVRDGQVFLLDREVGELDIFRCLDLGTGEELWQYAYEAEGRLSFEGSRTVPAIEEELVYTVGGMGDVYCFDRELQEVAFQVHLKEDYDGIQPSFGWSNSPIIYDDLLILTPLGEEVGMIALDRFTGDEMWATEGLGFSHSTPAIVELHGVPQVLFLSTKEVATGMDQAAPCMLSSFSPEDGSMLWRHEMTFTRLAIPPPISIDHERLFLTGGYRGGSLMLKVNKNEEEWSFEELFRIDRGSQIQIPLRHEDHLYVLVNENWNNDRSRQKEGGLLCLSMDGNEVWRTGDNPFFGRGNAVLVDGHLLIQDGFNGRLRVVKATPEKYTPVAEANVFGVEDRRDRQMWAPMAVSQGHLLLRSQDELKCLKLAP